MLHKLPQLPGPEECRRCEVPAERIMDKHKLTTTLDGFHFARLSTCGESLLVSGCRPLTRQPPPFAEHPQGSCRWGFFMQVAHLGGGQHTTVKDNQLSRF